MIAILTPYGRTETTAAAVRVAELAVGAGLDARLVSVGPREARVHPFWDRHVVCGRDAGLAQATAGATTCVWFAYGEGLRREAARVCPKAAHVLVPSWHGLPRPGTAPFPPYEQIVCPSKGHHAAFVSCVVPDQDAARTATAWARWDAGFPPVHHAGRADPYRTKALVYADAGAIDECPGVAVAVMDGLLRRCDGLTVTLLSSKSWSRPDRRRMAEMSRTWGARFTSLPPTDFQDQLGLMHDHDWFVYPAVRSDYALHPVRALHCGLPVVGWDVPPVNERVRTGHNGVLVGCEAVTNWSQAPTATGLAARFIDEAAPYLDDPKRLAALQRQDWGLKAVADAFRTFWLDLLGASER